ncbi:hypothetical protein HNQ79_006599 [Streptomyces candidus]|uniref:Uncharacterized protein n=1 Tax=Streptomyces candidus TaxID=67283 RepID=A0A7X0LUG8_9ACTN|nr:hypothetical protein [Streptomyces candidus]
MDVGATSVTAGHQMPTGEQTSEDIVGGHGTGFLGVDRTVDDDERKYPSVLLPPHRREGNCGPGRSGAYGGLSA